MLGQRIPVLKLGLWPPWVSCIHKKVIQPDLTNFPQMSLRRPKEITHLIDVSMVYDLETRCSCKTITKPETAVLPFLPLPLAASYWFQGSKILPGYSVLVQISFYWGLDCCRQCILDVFLFTTVSGNTLSESWKDAFFQCLLKRDDLFGS